MHTASGNNCTMTAVCTHNGISYSASSYITRDPNLVAHISQANGASYWTPRPGPEYKFMFDKVIPIVSGETCYVKFSAVFEGTGENCIQISSEDTVDEVFAYIWRYDSSTGQWVKELLPYRYSNNSWNSDVGSYTNNSGTWQR